MQSAITVAVRIRPFLPSENGNDDSDAMMVDESFTSRNGPIRAGRGSHHSDRVVRCVDGSMLVMDPKIQRGSANPMKTRTEERRMKFDRVYDSHCTQEHIYETTAKPLLDSAMEGYNSTIFAYGATGCGKTYTVCGSPEQPGLVTRIVQDLFTRVHEGAQGDREITLSLSYLQIYNEEIHDLLAPAVTPVRLGTMRGARGLQLREGRNEEMIVVNLSVHHPGTAEDFTELIEIGNRNRAVDATYANAVSSRSHAVLMLRINQREKSMGDQQHTLTSTFMIVDLAGNERAASSRNSGKQLIEGANINRSLLALAKCMSALASPASKTKHIPFRDSKLTRLLKYSLGGNCRTSMVVCVSPSSVHYEETLNSLQYAACAKNIRMSASVNQRSTEVHLANYQKRFAEQRALITELQKKQAATEMNTCQKILENVLSQLVSRDLLSPQQLQYCYDEIAASADPVASASKLLTTILPKYAVQGTREDAASTPVRAFRTPSKQMSSYMQTDTGSESKRRRWS